MECATLLKPHTTPTVKHFEFTLHTDTRDMGQLNLLFQEAFRLIERNLATASLESFETSPEVEQKIIEEHISGKTCTPDGESFLQWGWK